MFCSGLEAATEEDLVSPAPSLDFISLMAYASALTSIRQSPAHGISLVCLQSIFRKPGTLTALRLLPYSLMRPTGT